MRVTEESAQAALAGDLLEHVGGLLGFLRAMGLGGRLAGSRFLVGRVTAFLRMR